MITTIFSSNNSADRSIFAINLAATFTRNLRKVALVDLTASMQILNWKKQRQHADIKPKFAVHDPLGLPLELENRNSYLRTHYHEIIIDTDGADSWFAEAAMAASQMIIVPLWHYQDNTSLQAKLIERIERIRLFHPTLQVLIVDMQRPSAQSDAAARQSDEAQAFAQSIPGAVLADAVMHEWFGARRAFDAGLSIFESMSRNDQAEAEMKKLYQEICQLKDAPTPVVDSAVVTQAIQSIIYPKIHPKAHA
jgi:chromosome partitioning protein